MASSQFRKRGSKQRPRLNKKCNTLLLLVLFFCYLYDDYDYSDFNVNLKPSSLSKLQAQAIDLKPSPQPNDFILKPKEAPHE